MQITAHIKKVFLSVLMCANVTQTAKACKYDVLWQQLTDWIDLS